jgi:hypothetical protein
MFYSYFVVKYPLKYGSAASFYGFGKTVNVVVLLILEQTLRLFLQPQFIEATPNPMKRRSTVASNQ